jgi:hypothetical protein
MIIGYPTGITDADSYPCSSRYTPEKLCPAGVFGRSRRSAARVKADSIPATSTRHEIAKDPTTWSGPSSYAALR